MAGTSAGNSQTTSPRRLVTIPDRIARVARSAAFSRGFSQPFTCRVPLRNEAAMIWISPPHPRRHQSSWSPWPRRWRLAQARRLVVSPASRVSTRTPMAADSRSSCCRRLPPAAAFRDHGADPGIPGPPVQRVSRFRSCVTTYSIDESDPPASTQRLNLRGGVPRGVERFRTDVAAGLTVIILGSFRPVAAPCQGVAPAEG